MLTRIEKEREQRDILESKINKMKEKAKKNESLIQMQLSNDQAIKMEKMDRRNLMISPPNYTTHPDFSLAK